MILSEELQQYILHGQEEVNIEYKESMNWGTDFAKNKIIKCMLAMANNDDGGVIIIGVTEKDSLFVPLGMSEDDFDSYKQDDIGRVLRNYSDPAIKFEMVKGEMPIKKSGVEDIEYKKFCLIQVKETKELPVISTKLLLYNKTKQTFLENICLREGAVYIRTVSPVESREIKNQEEWRELLYRCMEKIKYQITKISPNPKVHVDSSLKMKPKDDLEKYYKKLKQDNLI